MTSRVILVFALAQLAPSGALAQTSEAKPAADRAEAKRYFEGGDQAYRAGQYATAARTFEEAYQRAPLPEITFSAAQAFRLAYYQEQPRNPETLRKALVLYRRYLIEAPRGKRRPHATMHIQAIEELLGPEVPPPPSPVPAPIAPPPKPLPAELLVTSRAPGARGRIDGGVTFEVPFSIAVTPGKHRVVVEAPGHRTTNVEWLAVTSRLVVAQVEPEPLPARLRILAPEGAEVSVNGRFLGVAPMPGPVEVEPGESSVRVRMRGRVPVIRSERVVRGSTATVDARDLDVTRQRVASHWLLGGAAALAVAGTTTTLLALAAEARVQRYDESRRTTPKTQAEFADRNSDLKARDDFRTASYALFGTALAVGATGGLLWWLDAPPEYAQSAGLQPWVGRDMLGLGWVGSH
ncbi:MAG: hypothetical protein AMXMBFR56_80050 [Polyangiaceae bacterium]